MLLTVQGQTGELRKGYRVAATLGPWTFTYADKRITAEVREVNAALMGLDDLSTSVRIRVGTQSWEWTDVTVAHNETSATVWIDGDPTVRG